MFGTRTSGCCCLPLRQIFSIWRPVSWLQAVIALRSVVDRHLQTGHQSGRNSQIIELHCLHIEPFALTRETQSSGALLSARGRCVLPHAEVIRWHHLNRYLIESEHSHEAPDALSTYDLENLQIITPDMCRSELLWLILRWCEVIQQPPHPASTS